MDIAATILLLIHVVADAALPGLCPLQNWLGQGELGRWPCFRALATDPEPDSCCQSTRGTIPLKCTDMKTPLAFRRYPDEKSKVFA